MIWACRGASAMPFIRVPDATEGEIQKATDIGAVGIIMPTVDTVEKAQNTVKWAKLSPAGTPQHGRGSVRRAVGRRLPADHNDNMLIVIMIERRWCSER